MRDKIRPKTSTITNKAMFPTDVVAPVQTGIVRGNSIKDSGVIKNAKTAWITRDLINKPWRMSVPLIIDFTCPKTESPLQAMIAFVIAIFQTKVAEDAAANWHPVVTSKKPPINGLAKPSPKRGTNARFKTVAKR